MYILWLRQHRVINDVGEVLFHQLVLVTTCYWLTNNSQVRIHNVHTILIYNIITYHPYQHDPYFLTPCRHQKPYHPISSLLDEVRKQDAISLQLHCQEAMALHRRCIYVYGNHLRYSQLWYIGSLRSTFQFKIFSQFVSPHFSFGIAAWAASTLFLIHHSRNVPCILEGFCLMEQFDWSSPTSLITRCLKEWMYEDVSVTVHMSCPHSFASNMFRSLLCICTVQGSTDISRAIPWGFKGHWYLLM